jgi:hypothetical protein
MLHEVGRLRLKAYTCPFPDAFGALTVAVLIEQAQLMFQEIPTPET